MSAKKKPSKASAPASLSFEQAAAELESIIERIESGEIGLEESLAQRKRGEVLLKRCRAVLDQASDRPTHGRLPSVAVRGTRLAIRVPVNKAAWAVSQRCAFDCTALWQGRSDPATGTPGVVV